MGTESVKKELHSRYWFAMCSLVLTFLYLFISKVQDVIVIQAMFAFMATVSLGFGISKATEYWGKQDVDKVARHTRFKYSIAAVVLSFAYLFTVKSPNPLIEQSVFAFLGTVAMGLGASKATEHLRQ